MELATAVSRAFEILADEVVRPTVGYREVYSGDWKLRLAQATVSVNPCKERITSVKRVTRDLNRGAFLDGSK
jgi:hypothetical protein